MSNKITKICKRCKEDTPHRFVKSKSKKGNGGYYSCSVCSENASREYRDRHRLRYIASKANARKKPGSEKMTEEILQFLFDRQNGKCAISGILFNYKDSKYKPSLDRIDSNKGYVRGNIQLVLTVVNRMKMDLGDVEFRGMCFNIADHFRNQYAPYDFFICEE